MNYLTAKEKIDKILNSAKVMYLATVSKTDEPSLRQMSVLVKNGKVYFQTDLNFAKTKDLENNPHVALGIGAYSFKGIAKLIGKPTENPWFLEDFKTAHLEAYNSYTFLPTEILFEVSLIECKIWDSHDADFDGKETVTTVDLVSKTASTIFCI